MAAQRACGERHQSEIDDRDQNAQPERAGHGANRRVVAQIDQSFERGTEFQSHRPRDGSADSEGVADDRNGPPGTGFTTSIIPPPPSWRTVAIYPI